MIRWRNVIRTAPLAAVLAGTAAAEPPGGFLRVAFEPRVEGIPFRAVSVAEFVANTNGNLAARRTTGVVARDAAGRTRREGAAGAEGARVVAIDDPVAGVRHVLFPDRGEGRRLTGHRREGRPAPARTVSLGTQVIAGVEAEGTRETIILPGHPLGDQSSVEVVSERWYSAELQTVVRHVHRGPRGETTWTLTEITRGDPEASLFEVPAGLEIEEGLR